MRRSNSTTLQGTPGGNEPAKAVFVLGMHRSGTSALTRVLNLLGMELGPDLLPAQPGNNEHGFWEPREIVRLNRRALAALGYSWFDVRAMPPRWIEQAPVQKINSEIRTAARRLFGSVPLWGVKDPRMCRLFPLWRRAIAQLGCEPFCVLMIRDPDEVARSLHARDRMGAGRSHLLWLRHVTEAEIASRGLTRVVVTFDELLADWRSAVAKIESAFGWRFPRSRDDAAAEVEAFLDAEPPGSARGRAPLGPAAASVPWVAQVHSACLRASRGSDITADAGYAAAVDALAAAEPVFGPLLAELARRSDSRFSAGR
jgi:hypothetical protein